MKLEQFGTRLVDYLDGNLNPAEPREIERLLDQSPEARRELERYRKLLDSLQDLPDSVKPERDLWPDITARLDGPAESKWSWRPLLLAAAMALAVLGAYYVSGLGGWLPSVAPVPGDSSVVQVVGRSERLGPGPQRTAVTQAEGDLLAASRQLRAALEEHRDSLPAATRELVERNLEIIEGAIAEIQQAIESDPTNPELNRMLVAYYQHELALLEQVSRAASRL